MFCPSTFSKCTFANFTRCFNLTLCLPLICSVFLMLFIICFIIFKCSLCVVDTSPSRSPSIFCNISYLHKTNQHPLNQYISYSIFSQYYVYIYTSHPFKSIHTQLVYKVGVLVTQKKHTTPKIIMHFLHMNLGRAMLIEKQYS